MTQLTSSASSQLEAGLSNLTYVRVVDSCAHCIKLKVHDTCLMLTIPAWYSENDPSKKDTRRNEDAEEVFMLTLSSSDDVEGRDWLPIFLLSTNERLERIRNGAASYGNGAEVITRVVEGIRKALPSVVEIDTDEENSESEDEVGNDESASDGEEDDCWYNEDAPSMNTQSEELLEIRRSSKVYLMAQVAANTCRDRFLASTPGDSGNEQWCSVHPNPGIRAVRLQIEVAGLVDNVEAPISVGIPVVGSCLEIMLDFSSDQWATGSKLLRESLDTLEYSVGASSMQGEDEEPRKARRKTYGLRHLVPELISRFLKQWGGGQEGVASASHGQPKEEQPNLFLDLLNHICVKLKTLCEFCPICLSSLPCQVGRLRPCNKDLCLYKFEELGMLTSILSELESPHVMELELSMALSAARSATDVFEPFPGYLLGHQEARGRNGWFTDKAGRSRMEYSQTNKDVSKVEVALKAVPALAKLKDCKDEAEVKEAMAVHWATEKEKDPAARRTAKPDVKQEYVSLEENLPYNLLHFVLSTNRCSMLELEQEEQLDIGMITTAQIMIINDSPEREAEFNAKRDARGSFYAFHGSLGSNWYSILRNGLRNMSATKYMSTGAAVGSGIYLGSNITISAAYSKTAESALGWSHSPYKTGLYCIAIVEAINGCLAYNTGGILVVKPEEERSVMIRYLLAFNYTPQFTINMTCSGKLMHGLVDKSVDLSKHFNDVKSRWEARKGAEKEVRKAQCFEVLKRKVDLESEVEQERERAYYQKRKTEVCLPPEQTPPILRQMASAQSLPGNLQAIQKEYMKLMRLQQKGNDSFPSGSLSITLPHEDSLLTWQIHFLPDLFRESPLGTDLAEAAALRNLQSLPVTLEILFPSDYPYAPPFVRVVSPHFMFHTGHITLGGSICMELLTASGWLPTYSIESVLVSILAEMHGGGARLDRQRMGHPGEYSPAEAKESFKRAALTHGWKI